MGPVLEVLSDIGVKVYIDGLVQEKHSSKDLGNGAMSFLH